MSYEPSRTVELPPNPPQSEGLSSTSIPGCARHRTTPAPNCRGCGTTNRQIAERAQRQRRETTRVIEADRFAKAGGALRRSPDAVDSTTSTGQRHLAQMRAALGSAS